MSIIRLILDFDGTITTKDTISHLASAGIAAQKLSRRVQLQPKWDRLVKAYLEDYDDYKYRFTPSEAKRTRLEDEKRFLSGLYHVERASLRRVEEAGIFHGMDAAAMRKAGVDALENGDVQLRGGFGRITDLARERGWPVNVVSVNWSADFVRGVLGNSVPENNVTANNTRDGIICGPDALGLLVCSPDKLRAMRHLGGADVYFGDSTTDLECLLEAERGVVMGDGKSSLLHALRRLGFEVPHVGATDAKVVWAQSFDEVLDSGMLFNA